jgi:hypothetical protein
LPLGLHDLLMGLLRSGLWRVVNVLLIIIHIILELVHIIFNNTAQEYTILPEGQEVPYF